MTNCRNRFDWRLLCRVLFSHLSPINVLLTLHQFPVIALLRLHLFISDKRSSHTGFWIPGAGFQSLSVELGFWIPIFSRIPDSTSKICRILESGFPYMERAERGHHEVIVFGFTQETSVFAR